MGASPMCLGDINGKPGCSRSAEFVVTGIVAVEADKYGIGLATVCERHVDAMGDFLSWPGDPAMVAPIAALGEIKRQLGGEVFELQAAS